MSHPLSQFRLPITSVGQPATTPILGTAEASTTAQISQPPMLPSATGCGGGFQLGAVLGAVATGMLAQHLWRALPDFIHSRLAEPLANVIGPYLDSLIHGGQRYFDLRAETRAHLLQWQAQWALRHDRIEQATASLTAASLLWTDVQSVRVHVQDTSKAKMIRQTQTAVDLNLGVLHLLQGTYPLAGLALQSAAQGALAQNDLYTCAVALTFAAYCQWEGLTRAATPPPLEAYGAMYNALHLSQMVYHRHLKPNAVPTESATTLWWSEHASVHAAMAAFEPALLGGNFERAGDALRALIKTLQTMHRPQLALALSIWEDRLAKWRDTTQSSAHAELSALTRERLAHAETEHALTQV